MITLKLYNISTLIYYVFLQFFCFEKFYESIKMFCVYDETEKLYISPSSLINKNILLSGIRMFRHSKRKYPYLMGFMEPEYCEAYFPIANITLHFITINIL